MVGIKESNDNDYKVVGLHITGPSAGDIIQGFAVAIKYVWVIHSFHIVINTMVSICCVMLLKNLLTNV